jgi:hypothetical protein
LAAYRPVRQNQGLEPVEGLRRKKGKLVFGVFEKPPMLRSEKGLTSCEKGFGVEKNLFIQPRGALVIFQKPEFHGRLSGLKLNDDA